MKVSIEEAGVCEKKIVIEFDESDVQNAYDSTFALFSKQASIKGFRPGKAPREMVVRRYGADILKYRKQLGHSDTGAAAGRDARAARYAATVRK